MQTLFKFNKAWTSDAGYGTAKGAMRSDDRGAAKSILSSIKPRPHQQQRPSNIVECYKSNDSFDKVERCFDFVAVLATYSKGRVGKFYAQVGYINSKPTYDKSPLMGRDHVT